MVKNLENGCKRLHAIVSGRVQRVGFRYFVMNTAVQLALSGWVKNKWDGNVEVLAEGSQEKLDDLLQALHQGPPSAIVESVEVEWSQAEGKFHRFHVKFS